MTGSIKSAGGLLLAGALTVVTTAAQVPATDAMKAKSLFEEHECAGCHQVETKVVGPSLKQVAGKYRNDKDVAARLVAKVKNGGVGVWGEIPMPPNSGITDEELKLVVAWILAM